MKILIGKKVIYQDKELSPDDCEIIYSDSYPLPDATILTNKGEFHHWFIFLCDGNYVNEHSIQN